MKKNIKRIFVISIMTMFIAGCNDEFLERTPLDEVSNNSFWNTEQDLKVYNNNFYNRARLDYRIPIILGHGVSSWQSRYMGRWHLDQFSDNLATRQGRLSEFQEKRAGKHFPKTGKALYGYTGWDFIRAINIGLANYDKANVTEVIRNNYKGEARLLRGWFYADKIQKFGTTQWVDGELNIDDEDILFGERDSRDFVMDKVLEDLKFAVDNIPDDWGDGQNPGRINRWGALMVLSRIALFEGTWRKYHGLSGAEAWLTEAANASLEIMQNGPYSLYQSGNPETAYNALHRLEDLEGNPEVIYWRKYELGINSTHVQAYHRLYVGGATKSMIEDYLCTDGLPISLSPLYQGDAAYENVFENRDPRLRQTILHPEDQAIYRYGNHGFGEHTYPRITGQTGGQSSTTGYHIIKTYVNDAAYAGFGTQTTPAITMRFAEALLNYAEAKADLGTLTQNDLDISINLLRDRVGMPHMILSNLLLDPRYTSDGVSAAIVEIRRERRVELFMEGFRYDDLRRWKLGSRLREKDYGMRWDTANQSRFDPDSEASIQTGLIDGVEYLEVYKGTGFENPEFDESKHYLWPIPISTLSGNPNIGQNPGWGD